MLAPDQAASATYTAHAGNYVSGFVALALVGALFCWGAVHVQRVFGGAVFWGLLLLPALAIAAVLAPDSGRVTKPMEQEESLFFFIFAMAVTGVAPLLTIWFIGRRPSPPATWKQVSLGVISMFVPVLLSWIGVVLVVFVRQHLLGR